MNSHLSSSRQLTVSLILFFIATFAIAEQGQRSFVGAQPSVCPSNDAFSCQEDSLLVRGGGDDLSLIEDVITIGEFLDKKETKMENFHVHGWRWHTMSLVREAGRLKKLAQQRSSSDANKDCPNMKQAVEYVIGFNMKGLHKIEADLFFPWMRKKLTGVERTDLALAFASVMDNLESDRQKVANLGESIQKHVNLLCDDSTAPSFRKKAIIGIARDAEELETVARDMMETENTLLVPSVAEFVSESEQKSFNNKVLRNLGILDSRLHLVSMHEAVWESNITEEKEMFKKAIPSIPQRLIPRWKRNLYEPRTSVLDL